MSEEPEWLSFYQDRGRRHATLALAFAVQHGQNTPEAHQQLAQELPNMVRALEWMQTHTHWHNIAHLFSALWEESRFLQDRGPAPAYLIEGKGHLLPAADLLPLLEMGVLAARELKDNHKLCMCLNALGSTLRAMGKVDEALALHNEALTIAQQFEDASPARQTLSLLGMVWIDKDVNQALPHLQKALNTPVSHTNVELDIDLFGALATAHAQLGQMALLNQLSEPGKAAFEKAATYLEKALGLATKSQDKRRQAELYHQRGYLRSVTNDLENARADFQQAADLSKEVGHQWGYGRALQALGVLRIQIGQVAQNTNKVALGITDLEKALTLLEQTGDGEIIASTLAALGQGYALLGQLDMAKAHLEHALEVIKAFSDLPKIAALEQAILPLLAYVKQAKGEK
ncbi:MAG: tetratricopeptide repeat-containing protein [Anaerolineae bacterium]|nr:tetratricopeptide repeat-containing protein [Anaerolineae bacterium]